MDNSTQDVHGPIVVVRVGPDGLHLETDEGQALFYFVPFCENTEETPVPWGSLWPVGIRRWILRWPPLLGNPQAGYGVTQRALGQQMRETDGKADEDYPGAQVTYRGWPLYLCNLTREPAPKGVLGLWERASIDLRHLGEKPDDLPTDPTRPFGGP